MRHAWVLFNEPPVQVESCAVCKVRTVSNGNGCVRWVTSINGRQVDAVPCPDTCEEVMVLDVLTT